MLIKVKQQDIDGSQRQDCMLCPLARAIYRQTGKRLEVFPEAIRDPDSFRISVAMPKRETKRIMRFDTTGKMTAHSVELDLEPLLETQ